MNIEQFKRSVKTSYKAINAKTPKERIVKLIQALSKEWDIEPKDFTTQELYIITSTLLGSETKTLHDKVEDLMAQQEHIQREIEKTTRALQHLKYDIFGDIEDALSDVPQYTLAKLHQIKFQSLDLFDMLCEMVESALITSLEKNDSDIEETIEEIIKDITYETINEGPINSIRIRKILSTILQTAVTVSEATPNQAEELLSSTLKGMKTGVIKSIAKFKQNLLNTPDEVKSIIIDDYSQTINELNHIDILFTQVITDISENNTKETKELLEKIQTSLKYDLQELIFVSKETVGVMKQKFNDLKREALQRSSKVLKLQKAQEASRMGKQAWVVAKTKLGSAIKSAKSAIDKKD